MKKPRIGQDDTEPRKSYGSLNLRLRLLLRVAHGRRTRSGAFSWTQQKGSSAFLSPGPQKELSEATKPQGGPLVVMPLTTSVGVFLDGVALS
jgi:hypothetical protein